MRQTATITMERAILDRLRDVARQEKRSLSRQLELVLEKHFGIAPPRAPRRAKRKEAAR